MARQKKAPARGRQRGRKNLKTNAAGNIVNQFGVEFTPDEKRALVNAVNRVNAKHRKMVAEQDAMPRKHEGRDTGDTLHSLRLMGKESEFIIAKRTKSLQRFTSKEQYNDYMRSLARVNSPDYVTDKIRLYKRNFMNNLRDVYGDEAKDIIMKVRMMKPEEYMAKVAQDETLEIRYVDSKTKAAGRLNQLRAALGMKIKDDGWADEYYE